MQSPLSQIVEQAGRTVGLDNAAPEGIYQIAIALIGVGQRHIIVISTRQRVPQRIVPNESLAFQRMGKPPG